MAETNDLNAWRQVHRHLTIAITQSRNNIATELTKRRFLLEEITRCKVDPVAIPGAGGINAKAKQSTKKSLAGTGAKKNPMSGKSPKSAKRTTSPVNVESSRKKTKPVAKKPSPSQEPTKINQVKPIGKGKELPKSIKMRLNSSSDGSEDDDDSSYVVKSVGEDDNKKSNAGNVGNVRWRDSEESSEGESSDGDSSNGDSDEWAATGLNFGKSAEKISTVDAKQQSQQLGMNPQQMNQNFYPTQYAASSEPDYYQSRYGNMQSNVGYSLTPAHRMGMGGQMVQPFENADQDDGGDSGEDDDGNDY